LRGFSPSGGPPDRGRETARCEVGYDTATIADMLGQETAGMAGWYSGDADLERKLTGVVEKIDEHLSNKSV
jgi:hypothetical protein